MDWSDSPEQATFRAKVQSVIDKMPERYKAGGGDWERDRNNEDASRKADAQQWTQALANEGWVAPHWWHISRLRKRCSTIRESQCSQAIWWPHARQVVSGA